MTFSFMVQFKLEDLKGEFLSSMVSIFKIIRQFLWSFCEKSILARISVSVFLFVCFLNEINSCKWN